MLELAAGKTAEEQSEAFTNAIAMLASDDCRAGEVSDTTIKQKLSTAISGMMEHKQDALDAEVDVNAEILADALSDAHHQDALRPHVPQSLFNASDSGRAQPGAAVKTSMMQTMDKIQALASSGSNADLASVLVIILSVISFIVLAFLLVFICFFVLAFVMSLLGLILCSLKSILYFVINIFKKKESKWRSDWKDCMSWWLSHLSPGYSSSPDLALCATELMQNNR
jgi:ABC-type multidrug transport system fused ATPase/permease subunit